MSKKKFISTLLLISILFISQALTPPKEVKRNLKVLPKDMPKEELITLMKGYAKSLGVKCNHCHTPLKDNPEKMDFASDENPHKDIARKMIKMTADINKKYISKIDNEAKVACITCHNGHEKPVMALDTISTK